MGWSEGGCGRHGWGPGVSELQAGEQERGVPGVLVRSLASWAEKF